MKEDPGTILVVGSREAMDLDAARGCMWLLAAAFVVTVVVVSLIAF